MLIGLPFLALGCYSVVYTWDFKSSTSVWNGLRVQPVLSDEIQTFKALIVVHKVLQEGHPIVRSTPVQRFQHYWLLMSVTCLSQVLKEAQANTGWLESAARTVGSDGVKGQCLMFSAIHEGC